MTKGFRDTPHDVFHAWNGNTVAQGTVACGVGSARHIRPAIRIALEAFTFDWNKPSNQKRLFQNYVGGVFALPGALSPRCIGLPKRIGSGAGIDLSLIHILLQEERRMPEWMVEQRIYVHRSL